MVLGICNAFEVGIFPIWLQKYNYSLNLLLVVCVFVFCPIFLHCYKKSILFFRFMVDLHVDKVKSYVTIVTKVAKEAGFTTTENIDWKRDYIATFERSEDCVEEKNGH